MNRNITLTGANGFIGQKLFARLIETGEKVTIFTRDQAIAKQKLKGAIQYVEWNYNSPERWKQYLCNQDAIIHLAGANLGAKRWSAAYKNELVKSRINSTKNIVNVINNCHSKPSVFITASATGYYGNRGEELLTEESLPGNDFLADLCFQWEREAANIEKQNVRRISLRIGPVLSDKEGMLKKIITPYRLFLGGKFGNGRQWFPWIHIDDLINIFIYLLNNDFMRGPINCVSPGIVRMKDFSKELSRVLHRPSFIKVPELVLKAAVGEIANVILASQNVSEKKLVRSGFNFEFPDLKSALRNLL